MPRFARLQQRRGECDMDEGGEAGRTTEIVSSVRAQRPTQHTGAVYEAVCAERHDCWKVGAGEWTAEHWSRSGGVRGGLQVHVCWVQNRAGHCGGCGCDQEKASDWGRVAVGDACL